MTLNGCSKKLCPMQVGTVDNCNLTKKQCPYFTQDIDVLKAINQIKAEAAREIIDDILSKIRTMIKEIEKVERRGDSYYSEFNGGSKTALKIVFKDIAELKKKYTEEQIC